MATIEDDIERLFDFLHVNDPFEGTSWELAGASKIPYQRLWSALHRIRSAEFIAEQHWTIPNVPKGMGYKAWSVAEESEDADALRDGFKVRAPEVFETIRRLQAQSALAVSIFPEGSPERSWWRFVNTMASSVVSAGEIMVAEVAPEKVGAGIASE